MLWFRKFIALLLTAVGIALVFLPFPDQLTGERVREVVRLKVQPAPLTPEAAKSRFRPLFVEFTDQKLLSYPEVHDAFLSFMGISGERCVPAAQWDTLLGDVWPSGGESMVYAFKDGIYRLAGVERMDYGDGSRVACIAVDYIGAYDTPGGSGFVRIQPGDLDPYPALKSEVERLSRQPETADALIDVTPAEWRRFHDQLLNKTDNWTSSFVIHGKLATGTLQDGWPVPWTLDAAWLGTVCRVLGLLAVVFGLAIGISTYRFSAGRLGIAVASPWLALFCDLILLSGGAFFMAVAMDALWVGPMGQASMLGISPEWPSTQAISGLHFISIPAVCIGLPLLSLIFTSLSTQRVRIDAHGVTSLGAIGESAIAWNDLADISLRDQKNPAAFTVMDFRSLQRVLDLTGADRSITINEPSSRRRKQEIIRALKENIPEKKRYLIENLDAW
mgnify:CR=1 FL=1